MPPLNKFQRSIIGLAIGNGMLGSVAVNAAIITVNSSSDSANPFGCGLREAIQIVNQGAAASPSNGCNPVGTIGIDDEILFGLPVGSNIELQGGQLDVQQTVSITGPGAEQLSIDGNSQSRIFYIDGAPNSSISGFTLNNGSADYGGAVEIRNSESFVITNTIISSNTAELRGGGIFISNSPSASISNSIITDNVGYSTYTVDAYGYLIPAATGYGGGISVSSSDAVEISDVTFSGNQVYKDGGAIDILNSNSVSISNSNITRNRSTAKKGGGIAIQRSDSLTLSDSRISLNSASREGGGIHVELSDVITIRDSLIWGNTAALSGAGLFVQNVAILSVSNTGIYRNRGRDNTRDRLLAGGVYLSSVQDLEFRGVTIAYNQAVNGGGLVFGSGVYGNIVNSTISNNTAYSSGNGGGLFASRENSVLLTSNTINGNSGSSGGGIYSRNPSSIVLGVNNVVANSVGGDCNMVIENVANNWVEDDTCLGVLDPRFSGDPLLGPLRDNGGSTLTHAPLEDSGLIDTGIAFNCNAAPVNGIDQRSAPRGIDTCFIGAVEDVQVQDDENLFVVPLPNGRALTVPL